jgi:hypothetical protein
MYSFDSRNKSLYDNIPVFFRLAYAIEISHLKRH